MLVFLFDATKVRKKHDTPQRFSTFLQQLFGHGPVFEYFLNKKKSRAGRKDASTYPPNVIPCRDARVILLGNDIAVDLFVRSSPISAHPDFSVATHTAHA
jgi:hypothetical protein